MGRVFHVGSDGDRMVTHVTDVVTTCADGTLRAPFIIKVRGGADGAKKAAAKRKAGEEVRVAEAKESDKKNVVDEGAEDGLTLNIGVGVSPNGSMTLELFHKWIDHFVDHCLLPGQGKGGPPASPPVGLSTHLPSPPPPPPRPSRAANPRPHPHPCPHTHPTLNLTPTLTPSPSLSLSLTLSPSPSLSLTNPPVPSDPHKPLTLRRTGGEPVFLFLDGHASRWSLAGLAKLRANNVFVICVPSHTTVWSQPNDNGINAAMKACTHTHACMYRYMHVYIHTCTCMYTCIHACMYTCIHGMRVYIHTWHACIYMYMHAMYVCMYVYHACTHTHIHP